MIKLISGDCLIELAKLQDNSVDSIVTDPPYGISFMGHKWDHSVPSKEVWEECLRVLKPGGHLLAFAGTRTQHRMAVRIEDAGFEIRDMIAWVYGTGFPKSLDVGKAIDKALGAERERKRCATFGRSFSDDGGTTYGTVIDGPPITQDAAKWDGWGTALKPSMEPITVARKPFKGTVAANVLEQGTGAINIDSCRVCTDGVLEKGQGRWPANLIHDGSIDVLSAFPEAKGQQGDIKGNGKARPSKGKCGDFGPALPRQKRAEKELSAARFFYCAKASKKDRGEGNKHPTVKPTDLMRYLCRLITPPGGVVLDPFMGSGSTGVAAIFEGFRFVGVEMDEESFNTAYRRIMGVIESTNKGQLNNPKGGSS